jgi:hypothetical protein
MDRLAEIHTRLEPLRVKLLQHPIYARLDGIDALRTFMEHHIFAVWDFMSLLKELQRQLSVVDVPWLPSPNLLGCRLVNEIVLAEESDEDGRGGYASHYDLYHRAMQTCGSDTRLVDNFLDRLRDGDSVTSALQTAKAPIAAQRFVEQTFAVIETGDLCSIASTFLFGREDLLPGLFQQIVDQLNSDTGGELDEFQYYLHRHIELDGEQHGPMAQKLMASLCGTDDLKWRVAEDAAVEALQARVELWDGVLATFDESGDQKRTA